eukprot:5831306-Pyramimonas_sp.AAC.1
MCLSELSHDTRAPVVHQPGSSRAAAATTQTHPAASKALSLMPFGIRHELERIESATEPRLKSIGERRGGEVREDPAR